MLAGLAWIKPSWRMCWFLALVLAFAAVVVMSVGLIDSGFARKWLILCWLVLSMSGYWVLLRVFHGLGGVAGETERDNMLWLIPLGSAIVPALVLIFVEDTTVLVVTTLLWSLVPTLAVQFIRPEIPGDDELTYEERPGVRGVLLSLFRPELRVAHGVGGANGAGAVTNTRRYSASTLIYYLAFAGEAVALLYAPDVIGSLRAQETAASLLTTYCTLVIAVVFGFGALLAATYRVPAKDSGWRMQQREPQILVIVYAGATFNLAVASMVGFAAPLIDRMGSLPAC